MKIKLRQAFDLQMGKTPARNRPDYWNGDHKWISIADIGNAGKFLAKTKESITEAGIDGSGIKVVPQGTVIMSFKLSIGKAAITSEDMYTNEAIMAFIDNGKFAVDTDYLYHLCCGTNWTAGTNKAVMGLTLNKATLLEKEIPLPDINEQHEIATKLDKIDAIIAERQQQLELIDQAVKSRFIELFGDPMTDVSKWSTSTIGEQFNVTSGGTPATGEKAYWENGTIPWIGSNMCQDTILSENDGKFITEEGYTHSSAKWFHKGTVLVALVGATIGKTALLRFDTTTNQNIAAIDVNDNAAFSSEFVFYHMQMLYSKFMEIGSGKFKMANQGFIRQLPLICPPIELQEQFAAFVEQTDKSKLCGKMEVAA